MKHSTVLIVTHSFPEVSETFVIDHLRYLQLYSTYNVMIGATNINRESNIFKLLKKNYPRIKFIELKKIYNPDIYNLLKAIYLSPGILKYVGAKKMFKRKASSILINHIVRKEAILNIHFHFGDKAKYFLNKIDLSKHIKCHATFHGRDVRILFKNPFFYTGFEKQLDSIFYISLWNFKTLKQFGFSNLKYLPNPIDFDFFNSKKEIRTSNKSEKLNILSIGRLEIIKGFHDSILAISDLINLNYNIQYKILGNGTQFNNLKSLIKTCKQENNIILLGDGNRNEVRSELFKCDLVLISSKAEALPMVMLEAMAMSKLVVATDVGGIKEYVNERYLIPESNRESISKTLISVIENRDDWYQTSIDNREVIESKHTIESFINKLESEYFNI